MNHYIVNLLSPASRIIYFLRIAFLIFIVLPSLLQAQSPADKVNVFLGSSGDHGQLSPGASSPFGMLSICPETEPHGHTGYENRAKLVTGFTHSRVEGVGCKGSGGNILIKPFFGDDAANIQLVKSTEKAKPGYYSIGFTNGINAEMAVEGSVGIEQYHFPASDPGFLIDFAHALANGFIREEHQLAENAVSGWIESGTTCRSGAYKVFYYLRFDQSVNMVEQPEHGLLVKAKKGQQDIVLRMAFSAIGTEYAKAAIGNQSFGVIKAKGLLAWNKELNRLEVKGDPQEEELFYSLLYRTMQLPYDITELDGSYRGTDGSLQHTTTRSYNGWAIWDNYRTQLPLLSLIMPDRYKDMVSSIAGMYRLGKKDGATRTEPSNTVRTEHAMVVLLDAYRKGYTIDLAPLRDSLLKETDRLDFSHPDKALESSYDTWAMSQILAILHEDSLSKAYLQKARGWRGYWIKDFQDLGKPDIDRMGARGMYQGTIWQYRWFVPFDVKGLITLCGGEQEYIRQLDTFFKQDLYNHANEPDIQAPYMYNATSSPWKSQDMVHKFARDTVNQFYFNDNSRGVDPFIDRIYRNAPDTYIRTMDDDAGAMSAWYALAASGLSPACVGWPIYYLSVPLFNTVSLNLPGNKSFRISVTNASTANKYIRSVQLNGKKLDRNWITQEEIIKGGTMIIEASSLPDKSFGAKEPWITDMDK